MFGWITKRDIKNLEEKTHESFSSVKKDMNSIAEWVKHLNAQDKQLFDVLNSLKLDLSSLKEEVESLRESLGMINEAEENRQLFKKLPVLGKQTAVEEVQKAVQTAVQTDNLYGVLKNLSGNERLLILALMRSDMKLSYEDLALLLGKERSTVRGQINSIKQKSEGLIEEMVEKNGKKRVYISEEIRKKMEKYANVRNDEVKKKRK